MILKNIRYLVTQNENRTVLENVDVEIQDEKIISIGKKLETSNQKTIDCSNKVVMPGLINAHTHSPMTLFRGISDNKILQNWLEEDIFPSEAKLTEEDVFVGSLLGCMEMLTTGTTTFNDMYDNLDQVAEAVNLTGIRAVLTRGILDKDIEGGRKSINDALDFNRKNQDENLVTPGFAPHAIYTVKKQTLREIKDYTEIFDTIYHIHVAETEKEYKDSIKETGKTPVQYLDSLNLVNNKMVAAHSVWLNKKDIRILSENNANVVHNPSANLKLGSGIAPIPSLIENKVNIALGTDGVASNNNLNLFEEAKIAAILHKREDPRKINEQQVLDMATVNGAKALDLEDQIGSISVGKKADMLLINLSELDMNPVYGKRGIISNLVYSFDGNVDTVIVDGKIRVKNEELRGLDKKALLKEINKRSEKYN